MEINLICAGCENEECDYFTLYNGCLLCSYCLDDFINSYAKDSVFKKWLKEQRRMMKKDRESPIKLKQEKKNN